MTCSMDDKLNRRQVQQTMSSMDDNLNGRQAQHKFSTFPSMLNLLFLTGGLYTISHAVHQTVPRLDTMEKTVTTCLVRLYCHCQIVQWTNYLRIITVQTAIAMCFFDLQILQCDSVYTQDLQITVYIRNCHQFMVLCILAKSSSKCSHGLYLHCLPRTRHCDSYSVMVEFIFY